MTLPTKDHNIDYTTPLRRKVDRLTISNSTTYPTKPFFVGLKKLHYPSNEAGSAGATATVQGKDVLVVEDEPYLCDLISDVLEAEGHTARKAANGLEALERLRERRPHLIMLDLMMPIMDGWEFINTMRSHPEWDGIPVVVITAVYDVARTQRETGAKAVVTKPFDIDQLGDLVAKYAE